jgi:excisionase family DNA binding protein
MTRRVERSLGSRGANVAVLLCCLFTIATAEAGDDAPCQVPVLTLTETATLLRVDAADLERLAEQGGVPGRRIGTSWRFACTAVMTWLNGPVQSPNAATPLTAEGMAAVVGTGVAPRQGDASQASDTQPAAPSQDAIGEAPEERTAEDVFLRGNRVLLGRGDVVLDFGQFYSRSDVVQLIAAGGSVGLGTLEQRALSAFLVARVGVLDETELFASTTFNKLDTRQLLGGATLGSSARSALGATGVGIRRTLVHENVGRPDVVLTLNGLIPNRDTLPAVGGGVVLVKSIDPVVLFANANYLHPFARQSNDGRLAAVDTVDISVGYGLGLNDTVAISMGVGGLFTRTTLADAATSRPVSLFNARFGLTTSIGEGLYLEPSISFGLSGPGHRFAFGVTMPYAF